MDRKGRQVFFLKRAQILVSDVWSAFGRRGIGGVGEVTTFPDYRVPQLLREVGCLAYGEELAGMVDRKDEIGEGGWSP